MPDGCKDPDEVLARHGPANGAARLFTLDRAEPGAVWLARHELARCPPVTAEAAAHLRARSAESARVMPVSGRPGYAARLAPALGVSAGALLHEWARDAAEARARAVREGLRGWASEWVRRLDRGSLGDHLDEATRALASAGAGLWEHEGADVEATASPDSPVDGSPTLEDARGPDTTQSTCGIKWGSV